jgi:hypothetical protein
MTGVRSRRLSFVTVIAVVGLMTAVVVLRLPSAQRVAATSCSLVTERDVSGVDNVILSSVGASGPRDVWVVGEQYGSGHGNGSAARHWNGTSWRDLSPGQPSVQLQDVAVRSPTDAWAVGASKATSVIDHWDGSAWSLERTPPNHGATAQELLGVSARAPDDVWAVGTYRSGAEYRTLIEHWNGSAWLVVPTPTTGPRSAVLKDVVTLSPDDAWAVGWHVDESRRYRTLAEHWDGSVWTIVPTPGSPTGDDVLTSVAAASPDDVWAVGHSGTGDTIEPLAVRWDGQAWTVQSLPAPGSDNARLTAIALASGDPVVAGQAEGDGGVAGPLVYRKVGTEWTEVASDGAGDSGTFLTGIAAPVRGGIFAVGAGVYDAGYGSFVVRGC